MCSIVRVHLPELIDEVDAVVPLVERKTVLNAYSIGTCVVWDIKKKNYVQSLIWLHVLFTRINILYHYNVIDHMPRFEQIGFLFFKQLIYFIMVVLLH